MNDENSAVNGEDTEDSDKDSAISAENIQVNGEFSADCWREDSSAARTCRSRKACGRFPFANALGTTEFPVLMG